MTDGVPLVTSDIAIYTVATGALVINAPAGTPLRAGQASVVLPVGYSADTHTWSTATKTMVEDLAKLKTKLVGQVKQTNETYVRALYTTNFGKQKKYSRKQQEVMDFRALAPVTTSLASALTVAVSTLVPQFNQLGTTAQKKKFRFAMAEAALRGVTIDVVVAEWEATIEAIETKIANYEAIEQAAVRAINSAANTAAARAVVAAINWSWSA